MRTLTLDEVGFVSGGDDEPMQEVVVNGRRMSPEEIETMMGFLRRHTQMDGGGGSNGEVIDEVVVEASRDCEDHCSFAPDIVPESCKQHDKDYSKDSELSRKEADDRFLENMKKELAEKYPDMPKAVRDAIANGYYKAVREFGHLLYEGKGTNDRVVTEGDDIPRIPRF
jgi:hypothetical protein